MRYIAFRASSTAATQDHELQTFFQQDIDELASEHERIRMRARIARMPQVARMLRVAELKRVHAEGRAAKVGAANPYRGQIVNAAVWRGGYRRMLDDKLAKSPARQAYLRNMLRRN